MKTSSFLLNTALAGCLAVAGLSVPSAQARNDFRQFLLSDGSSLSAAVGLPGMHKKSGSFSGSYTSSDNTTGTFVETRTVSGAVTTDQIVYTQDTTALISTDTAVVTLNTDGSATLAFTHLGFGSTVPFTSTLAFAATSVTVNGTTKTFPGSYGVGTYTYASGAVGVLSTFVTSGPQGTVAATDLLGDTTGLTRELLSVQGCNGSITIKTIRVTEDGTLTTITVTLANSGGNGGGSHGHGH